MKFLSIVTLMMMSVQANAQVVQGGNPFPEMKSRMATCQNWGNASAVVVCAASVILDGLEFIAMRGSVGQTNIPTTPNYPPQSQQKLVVIYGASDNCSSGALASVAMTGSYVADQNQCNNLPNKTATSWSISVNGRCINIQDTNVIGACLAGVTANPQ